MKTVETQAFGNCWIKLRDLSAEVSHPVRLKYDLQPNDIKALKGEDDQHHSEPRP